MSENKVIPFGRPVGSRPRSPARIATSQPGSPAATRSTVSFPTSARAPSPSEGIGPGGRKPHSQDWTLTFNPWIQGTMQQWGGSKAQIAAFMAALRDSVGFVWYENGTFLLPSAHRCYSDDGGDHRLSFFGRTLKMIFDRNVSQVLVDRMQALAREHGVSANRGGGIWLPF